MAFENESLLEHEQVDLISHLRRILGSLSSFGPESQSCKPAKGACRMTALVLQRVNRTKTTPEVQLFPPLQLSLCLLGWTNLHKLEKSKSPTHWRLPETLHSLSGNGLVSPPTKNYEHREFLIKASFLSLEKTYSRPCFHFQHRNRF